MSEKDDLVAGAVSQSGPGFTTTSYGQGEGGKRGSPYPEFEQLWTPGDRSIANRNIRQVRSYIQSGAGYEPARLNFALAKAGAWQSRQQARAANIVANRTQYVEMATRLDGIGRAYPFIGADVAFALAMSGHGPESDATAAAAAGTAATDPKWGQSTVPEADTDAMSAEAALEFARINANLSDADLVAELRSRGFSFENVGSFTWDGTQFRSITDPNVTAPIHEVLAAEADLEGDDSNNPFGQMFGGLKWFSRGTTAFLFAPWQALNGAIRENYADAADRAGGYDNLGADDALMAIAGAWWGRGWDAGWDETDFAEASRQLWRHGQMDAGTGWLMGGSVTATKTARDFAFYGNQIGDEPATMGRLYASTVFDPGSQPYRISSGIVDGIGALGTDPSTYIPMGFLSKITKATPGLRGFQRASQAVEWADNAVEVEISKAPTLLDEAAERLPERAAPRATGFPRSKDAPRMADQAGVIHEWSPRWYGGGATADAPLLRLLRGGKDSAEGSGLKLRSRRKVDGLEPVTFEIDPTDLRGYIDTDPAGDWARQLDRPNPYSSQVVPYGETLDDLRSRVTTIHLREPLDSAHPLSDELNRLVTEQGWHRVSRSRNVVTSGGEQVQRRTISYYRPDQQLPPGTRVSPFVDTVDTTTGEINRVIAPSGQGLDVPLSNWSPSVTADLSGDTVLTHFPEHRPLRTQELYDKQPLEGVTNPELLSEIPDEQAFRVMYATDDLRGGVDVEGGTHQINQAVWRDTPEASWPAPRPPKELTPEKAREMAAREFEKEMNLRRGRFHEEALKMVDELESAAGGQGAPQGFIRSLSKPAQERALRDGEVPLEDLLNAYDPADVEDLARYMAYGPVPEDRVMGVRAESTRAINDQIVYDAVRRSGLPEAKAAKIIEDWRAGKKVKIRTEAQMKALAQPEGKIVGRVVDAEGNVVKEGRRQVVRTKRVGGGSKVHVQIPGINVLDDVRANAVREIGDTDEIARYFLEENAARRAAAADDAGPMLYAAEKGDTAIPVGKAESGYPDFRLFDTARTASTSRKAMEMEGHRVVRLSRRKTAKVMDLDSEDAKTILREHLTERMEAMLAAISDRGANATEEMWTTINELEQAIQTGRMVDGVRKLREVAALMPESQADGGARAAAEMERLLDRLRADGFDAVKWNNGTDEIYEVLDRRAWTAKPIKVTKESEQTRSVIDTWDEGKFGVRFSGRQPVLRESLRVIDAPRRKPAKMKPERWNQWQQQRERLLARGWIADEGVAGREVLRRPLAGEHDAKAAADLHSAMAAGDMSRPMDDAVGMNVNGTRKVMIPEQFYNFVTDENLRPHWEKVAASDSFEDIVRLVGQQPAAVIGRLVRAKTADDVLEAIIDEAGLAEIRRLSIEGKSAAAARNAVDTVLHRIPGFRKSLNDIRLLHVMPGQYVNLRDVDQAAYEAHNWLMTAKVPKAQRDEVMRNLLAQGTSFGRKEVYYKLMWGSDGVIAASLREHLLKAMTRKRGDADVDEIIRKTLTLFRADHERQAQYHIKAPNERGYVSGTRIAGNDAVVPSPMLLGDFFDEVMALPNPREIKRMTGMIGRMAASGYDVKRAKVLDGIIRGLDGYNNFFKVTALARVAYPVRVLLEEQGRLYGAGLPNIYSHPLTYMMLTIKGHKGTDLMGRKWLDMLADPDPTAYGNAMVTSRLMMDNDDTVKFLSKHYTPVINGDERFLDGWMFGLGKLAGDPVAKRLAGKWTKDEIAFMPQQVADEFDRVQQVAWWLTNHETGREYLTSLREASRLTLPDFNFSLSTQDGVRAFVKEVDDQVGYMTAQRNPDLLEVIRTGRLKAGDDSVSMYVDSVTGKGGQTYNAGRFTKALANYRQLDAVPATVIAPDAMATREMAGLYDRAVTQMFSLLNGRPTNYLSRSPVFIQHYTERIANYLHAASDEALEALEKNLDNARLTRPQRKMLEQNIARRRAAGAKGQLTASDVDRLAKADALERVKDLLYDTSNKSHLWDAMRLIAPFGSAWAEVMKTWTKIAWDNPKVLDRLAHAISGAESEGSNVIYDVTGTVHDAHQGFFFEDPNTGDESFAWPMPALAQQFLTMGTPSNSAGVLMPAPVRGLNLIGQVQPGFGPLVTAPANLLLNQPGWREDVLNFIAPFGGPSPEESGGIGNAIIDSVTPPWLRKLLTAVYPVNQEQKSQLASATLAAQVHLASTGKYDLGDQNDVDRLLLDAQNMARRVYFLRAIGQFFLPTIGAPEQAAYTGNGELVLQAKLSSILRQYQSDPGEGGYGYQEGYMRFLRDYGTELYLLGVDRTDSTGYMAPTRPTYDWMRKHPDLMRKYQNTWGLLVDNPGNEFYYPAYQAQIRGGFRTLLAPEDLVKLANARLGRALYTSYRNRYGASPTEAEYGELRLLQDRLETQFPGYTRIPEQGFTTPGRILELERAAGDPVVQKLPVGLSLKTYFDARRAYTSQGISSFRTGTGREVAPELWALGTELAASDPTFRVAWDRLLSYEFDAEQFGE